MSRTKKHLSIAEKFGYLTVSSEPYYLKNKSGRKVEHYEATCKCGGKAVVSAYNLKSGHTKSCGCYRKEQVDLALKTHGETQKTPEYIAWNNAKQRCIRTTHKHYFRYGGRGISMCKRWLDGYENFLEDMGRRPSPKHSLDRKDNDGNYDPENCKWSTQKEQIINSTISVPVININTGVFFDTIKEAAHGHNIKPQTLRYRVEVNKGNIVRI